MDLVEKADEFITGVADFFAGMYRLASSLGGILERLFPFLPGWLHGFIGMAFILVIGYLVYRLIRS